MAIYHFSAKVISRSTGRSAVAAAAYRSASRLFDERTEQPFDYSRKSGVLHSEILLPDGAPERWSDRQALWNEVEWGEKRKDAQLSREIEFALPREMQPADAIELARAFVERELVRRGMVADLNVHCDIGDDGLPRPHAHVMLALREVGADGFGAKARDWNSTALLEHWREAWAKHVNVRLAELDHDIRIDHRSLKDQGIDLEPQFKIGPAAARSEARGQTSERADQHRDIARRNGERLLRNPAAALEALTHTQETFTRHDLARFVFRHTDGKDQFDRLHAKVLVSPELVHLGMDERGRERFTSRDLIRAQEAMLRASDRLESQPHRAITERSGRAARAEMATVGQLGDEQVLAVAHVLSAGCLAAVVGYAGTGKSTALGVARAAWEAEGYRVVGAALSGIAAENLEKGSGIPSRTLASLEYAWARDRDHLTRDDVLVNDEAGMVGTRQMRRILEAAERGGAKVVMVGDPEQLQAIEAGAPFRRLVERHGAMEITEVRRQREGWQRAATIELARGRTEAAIQRYDAAGAVHGHDTRDEARWALVADWMADRVRDPTASQMLLAYTRADVAELNRLARETLRAAKKLGPDQAVETTYGERPFAVGDRVMFLRNERSLGVKNGTLATLVALGRSAIEARLDDGRNLRFDRKEYADLTHGYAATIHKVQGATVDRTYVLASRHINRHAAYVAMTRHRDATMLRYGRSDYATTAELTRSLSRWSPDRWFDWSPRERGR
ncbi:MULTISPECIES: Ti-type conjugative transfer relaxase TraA [unclassified Brevundimonas]|uniref:Ti-type conjugative transfer relaxase TraA n=1 Tax=unclassified Brevundimonas TaxID=2622653 RepID=UPI000CFD0FB3|nr:MULTISPECIES: Ti-type conjugative transfer relaxase TraA [unclassified Brevundimonas]PRA30921.1 Ti-type conjugative transfer relaxase TraA [Brevundimonas sp. MYb27]PQZ82821.1 Ti-type conjugative transfer relaxase TraA [Brevundimonas sp. MYb31]PRB16783.1 Ti-type conjugative transfer relaxase TraA [Brevundimonas sp. MYb52]PRB34680.1 Ti-type conjugative transfer relaxase TraA [Brevundimonas sp. MYb46]PRB54753.1 Ti-type conjugative transfer relaxase TraA [Brevundimonas sp. MYb33]